MKGLNLKYEIRETDTEPAELLYLCGLWSYKGDKTGKKNVILKAYKNDETLGCIEYSFFRKGEKTGLKYNPRYPGNGVNIERIAVAGKWRNNGVGRELVEACVRDARIADSTNDFLFADDIDPESAKFFEKCGLRLKTSEVCDGIEVIYGVRYIGNVQPEYFLENEDLEERKKYWKENLK